jgi:hypothetical protein
MIENSHLVIWISDDMYGLPNIVDHHHSTAFTNNEVWFGKPEHAIPQRSVAALNKQIKLGIPTQLIILNAKRYNKLAYTANLLKVSLKTPKEEELIPQFYTEFNLISSMNTWLKIEYPIDHFSVDEYPEIKRMYLNCIKHALKYSEEISRYMPSYFILKYYS